MSPDDPRRNNRWFNSRVGAGLITLVILLLLFSFAMFKTRMQSNQGKGNTAFQERNEAVTVPLNITWDPNPSPPPPHHYRAAWGNQPNSYTDTQAFPTGTLTGTIDLPPGETEHIVVKAVEANGQDRGEFSSPEVVYTVPGTPAPATPTPAQPFLTVSPTSVNFTDLGDRSIQITASNGAGWTSFDNSPWFDAHPTNGPSGSSCVLTPHGTDYPPWVITFSAANMPSQPVNVTFAQPSPTPPATPTIAPSPTPIPPTPFPSPSPTVAPTATATAIPATPTIAPTASPSPPPIPSATPTVTPSPAPNFALSILPVTGTLPLSRSLKYVVTITRSGGFNNVVTLTVAGLPKGTAIYWSPNPTSVGSTMTISVNSCVPAGNYPFMITGIGCRNGIIERAVNATLIIP